MEKLRCGSSSGELPIDMQRTVGEINPRHHLLHLQSRDCSSLRTAVSNTPHTVTMLLSDLVLDYCERLLSILDFHHEWGSIVFIVF